MLFWMNLLIPHPTCVCSAGPVFRKIDEGEKLMQFLLGWNDAFETVHSQILLLKPLPTMSRVYSMVLQDEDQRLVTSQTSEMIDSAMYVNNRGFNTQAKGSKAGGFKPRLTKDEKKRLKCMNCNEPGHEVRDCFKLHGYPEWYKKMKEQRGREQIHYAVQVEEENHTTFVGSVEKIVHEEIGKYFEKFQPNVHGDLAEENVNLVRYNTDPFAAFDGHYAFCVASDISKEEWILDSGARTHICCNAKLLNSVEKLQVPQKVYLPDGSMQWIHYIGKAHLSSDIMLEKVLLATSFTHNLISVAQLVVDLSVKCKFLDTHCSSLFKVYSCACCYSF